MSFDLNDVEPQQAGDLIPDGTFAKVTLTVRKGGTDGMSEIDRGLLKPSNKPGSDVVLLDCEFTVQEGPFARRKFWQNFTITGGKCDETGVSIGWNIAKKTFRAMVDSALGLDPQDTSDSAKAKRSLRGLADLDGITFAAKIKVEASRNAAYGPSNRLDYVVLPNAPDWPRIMNGEAVPAQPTQKAQAFAQTPDNEAPAWKRESGATEQAPAWQSQPTQSEDSTAQPPAGGPAWLNP